MGFSNYTRQDGLIVEAIQFVGETTTDDLMLFAGILFIDDQMGLTNGDTVTQGDWLIRYPNSTEVEKITDQEFQSSYSPL